MSLLAGACWPIAASAQDQPIEPAASADGSADGSSGSLPDAAPDDAQTPDDGAAEASSDASPDTSPDRADIGTVTPHRRFDLTVGAGKLLTLPVPAGSAFVADPTIADVQPPTASSVFVFGKKPGQTTLFVLNREGRVVLAYILAVEYDQSALQRAIAAEAPGLSVQLVRTPSGLLLQGAVPNAATAAHLYAIAQRYAAANEPVVNQLQVGASTQVNLRVRVAEVSRSVSRELGFNWSALFSNLGAFAVGLQTALPTGALSSLANGGSSSGGVSQVFGNVAANGITGFVALDAMADEGLVTLLAEPNLTTTSGEPASFLAGGEFPIPIPQGLGSVAIEYKRFGVSLEFTPTVLSNAMISMKVRPEVSELSSAGSLTFPGTQAPVPALVTRRAQTTVQLASGQSFAIAGLIQNDAQNNVSKVPWLGDVPILGALFRSTQFQRDQTELMIVVTAYVVHPTDKMPELPTDLVRQTSDLERLLLDRVAARATHRLDPERMPHLAGAGGFMFE